MWLWIDARAGVSAHVLGARSRGRRRHRSEVAASDEKHRSTVTEVGLVFSGNPVGLILQSRREIEEDPVDTQHGQEPAALAATAAVAQ